MKVIKNVEEIRKIISESILSGKYGYQRFSTPEKFRF